MLIVCGDSHTSTHGALGALAFGIGASEVAHVLATQTLWQRKPQHAARHASTAGSAPASRAKDVILAIIAQIGAAGATGPRRSSTPATAIRALSMEGAHDGLQHVDRGRRARRHDRARRHHLRLARRPAVRAAGRGLGRGARALAHAARRRRRRASTARSRSMPATIAPMVTWGTSPEDALPITGRVPDPADAADADAARRDAARARLHGPHARHAADGHRGRPRLHRLLHQRPHRGPAQRRRGGRAAASVAEGVRGLGRARLRAGQARRPRPRGSTACSAHAGFQWRYAGCSMCLGTNGDQVAPGQRCASTSNRNFVGRQGPGARTHLMSPAMAAAAAVTGRLDRRARPAAGAGA